MSRQGQELTGTASSTSAARIRGLSKHLIDHSPGASFSGCAMEISMGALRLPQVKPALCR